MGASSLSTFPAPTVSGPGLTKPSSLWQRFRTYESVGPSQPTIRTGINTPDDKIVLFATGNNGFVYSTSNGVDWTTTQQTGSQPYFNDVAINSAMNLVVGVESSATYYYATSIFGPYTTGTTPFGNASQITCDGTTFYMSGQTGQLATSTNGTTWTTRTLTSATGRVKLTYEPVNNVVWAFDGGTGRAYRITNGGATITALGVQTGTGDYSVAYAGAGAVAFVGFFSSVSYMYFGTSTISSLSSTTGRSLGDVTNNNDYGSGSGLCRGFRFIPGLNAIPTVSTLDGSNTVSQAVQGSFVPQGITLWDITANKDLTMSNIAPTPLVTIPTPAKWAGAKSMVYGNSQCLVYVSHMINTNDLGRVYSMSF